MKRDMAYTRQEYIHRVPQSMISRFTLGDSTAEYEFVVSLIASKDARISSNALEAIRITTNKTLAEMLGEKSYLLKIIPYPHLVVREHKFMSFAGADRLSQGMGHAFGRPTKRVAVVRKGKKIISVFVNREGVDAAKKAIKKSSKRLPVKNKISIEELGDV